MPGVAVYAGRQSGRFCRGREGYLVILSYTRSGLFAVLDWFNFLLGEKKNNVYEHELFGYLNKYAVHLGRPPLPSLPQRPASNYSLQTAIVEKTYLQHIHVRHSPSGLSGGASLTPPVLPPPPPLPPSPPPLPPSLPRHLTVAASPLE